MNQNEVTHRHRRELNRFLSEFQAGIRLRLKSYGVTEEGGYCYHA